MEPSFTGIKLRELREEKGWSLNQLSDKTFELGCRISPQAISAIELGGSQNPTRRVLKPIAKALDVPLNSLYEGDEDAELVGVAGVSKDI